MEVDGVILEIRTLEGTGLFGKFSVSVAELKGFSENGMSSREKCWKGTTN